MKFSIIYSFDCSRSESVKAFQPPKLHKWDLTERSDGGEDNFYTEIVDDGPYGGWKHRKYVAILDKAEFIEFVEHLELRAENVETMGSLGAPGFGFGWAPAISFNSEWYYYKAYGNAYVTPLPEVVNKPEDECFSERDWDRLREVVIGMFR